MKNIKSWLSKNGHEFKVEKYNMHEQNKSVECIMVDNNYTGWHPTHEALSNYTKIQSYIRKHQKNYEVEQRGHYTGILIYPKK